MSKNKISLTEIKKALLHDARFRDSLPVEYKKEITEFLSNPGCPCNISLYRKIMLNCREQLFQYFPDRELYEEDIEKLAENKWIVINCSIRDLELQLRSLPASRIQFAIARYQEEATVVVDVLHGSAENNWFVINCPIEELEERMKHLPPGRKQVAVARFENQITAIINELNLVY
jgi:hypothetical protein